MKSEEFNLIFMQLTQKCWHVFAQKMWIGADKQRKITFLSSFFHALEKQKYFAIQNDFILKYKQSYNESNFPSQYSN